MAIALKPTLSEALSELNTTPLIDILLVLLVMFIITIPAATHETAFACPPRARLSSSRRSSLKTPSR